jgi:hypothetical protein
MISCRILITLVSLSQQYTTSQPRRLRFEIYRRENLKYLTLWEFHFIIISSQPISYQFLIFIYLFIYLFSFHHHHPPPPQSKRIWDKFRVRIALLTLCKLNLWPLFSSDRFIFKRCQYYLLNYINTESESSKVRLYRTSLTVLHMEVRPDYV